MGIMGYFFKLCVIHLHGMFSTLPCSGDKTCFKNGVNNNRLFKWTKTSNINKIKCWCIDLSVSYDFNNKIDSDIVFVFFIAPHSTCISYILLCKLLITLKHIKYIKC